MIELLAPAGDLVRAKVAYDYGADAVYVGGKRFSLRAKASNFDVEDIAQAVQYGHALGRKLFVTVNMIPHQEDMEGIEDYLLALYECHVDAIIVASVYIAVLSKRLCPQMEVHMSTQLSITNHKTIEFYKSLGVDRVVLARELDLDSVQRITAQNILPIEVFIHGGMCVNYSGRCTLSNQMTLRDANRGGCAQSCRWLYEMSIAGQMVSQPDVLFSMSSKDMSTLGILKDLMRGGVVSLKIEGRMKSAYYIAVIVKAYRTYIDALLENRLTDALEKTVLRELKAAESRPTSDGFYTHLPKAIDHLYQSRLEPVFQVFVGTVVKQEEDRCFVEVRNNFKLNEELEILSPLGDPKSFILTEMWDEEGNSIEVANNPMRIVQIKVTFEVKVNDFIRKKGA